MGGFKAWAKGWKRSKLPSLFTNGWVYEQRFEAGVIHLYGAASRGLSTYLVFVSTDLSQGLWVGNKVRNATLVAAAGNATNATKSTNATKATKSTSKATSKSTSKKASKPTPATKATSAAKSTS